MAVANTKVPLFKDQFWHFQIKMKFRKKITRQGSVRLLDASSNINEVIRSILNFSFFLREDFASTKKHKNASSVFYQTSP